MQAGKGPGVQVKFVGSLAAAAAVFVLAGACAAAELRPDQAIVGQGALSGAVEGDVAIFKNIPYAAPPVAELRWRAPQPAPSWQGVRDATAYGPTCIQTPGDASSRGPESEDCLTLNIWTPAARAGGKLPVMVWIHGGGFTGGAGSRYNGTQFAKDGVVLVTINYRLGRFGFFAHPALAKTSPDGELADFGLMDQIAALKWVKANIAAFGGDPSNVTVFGESAGAMSVNYLLTSPLARGLFEKAISESGFARTMGRPLAAADGDGVAFADTAGVKGDGPDAAAALRALPVATLARDPPSMTADNMIGPIIDGVVAKETVAQAFARGDQARVPAIFGGNSFEASLLPDVIKNPDVVLSRLGDKRAQAVALYGGGDPATAAANIVTLSQVIEPDRFEAREDARRRAPAWVYYFSYLPAVLRPQVPGAGHGWEIAYVFDRLTKVDIHVPPALRYGGVALIPAATPEDEAIAHAMHAYWVAFAKAGYPGSAGGPAWPAVAKDADPVMEFGVGGPAVRSDFKKLELDVFTALAAQRAGAVAKP